MNLPPELITALLAMLPITEMQASIPLGVGVYGLPVWSAYLWSVLGSLVSAFIILWLLPPVTALLTAHFAWLKKILDWIFERTRSVATQKFVKYGQFALLVFMAIPGPGSGVWTSALIAFLFNIPKGRAWLLIAGGVLWLGLLVALITQGAVSGLDWLVQ